MSYQLLQRSALPAACMQLTPPWQTALQPCCKLPFCSNAPLRVFLSQSALLSAVFRLSISIIMESLAAFSLACGVCQLISFGKEAITTCRQIQKHGSTASHKDLRMRSEHITEVAGSVRDRLDALTATGQKPTDAESQLQQIAGGCVDTAARLQKELSKLAKGDTQSRRAAFKMTVKTLWHREDVEALEQKLEKYQAVIQTSVLTEMR